MGEWKPVVTPGDRQRYNELLSSANEAYSGANMRGLNRLLDERDGRAYIYTETNPFRFHILLLMTPSAGDTSYWKAVNVVPSGGYEPATAVQISIEQIRAVLDEVGATSFFGLPRADYGDPRLNEFFRLVPQLVREFDAKEASSHGKVRYEFKTMRDRREECK